MGRSLLQSHITEKIAYCFDIDGVLLQGRKVLPSGLRAMKALYQGSNTPIVPVCFLTNGGGQTESQKALELSKMLQVNIEEDQVVLSHTPFKGFINKIKKRGPALIIGRDRSIHVAQQYGLDTVLTPKDLAARNPACVPFLTGAHGILSETRSDKNICGTLRDPIQSILIFTDPAGQEWYIDLQVTLDLLISGGIFGGMPKKGAAPDLYVSHCDILWKNEFPAPRLGLGSFILCLERLYWQISGDQLQYKRFGKPQPEPYTIAADSLRAQARRLWKSDDISRIYAIGDNPEVDVRGANRQGRPWESVLVRTGVFQGTNCNSDRAKFVVDTVEDAIYSTIGLR